MSEPNRIKLLELAIQGGATIENATKVASDWEQWATEDDPLRLGVPSPEGLAIDSDDERYLTHKDCGLVVYVTKDEGDRFDGVVAKRAGSAYAEGFVSSGGYFKKEDFFMPKNPGKSQQEIDWSRLQLVHSTIDPALIVRVDRDFTSDCFHGTVINRGVGRINAPVGTSGTWDKDMFVYHGEVPQEPKTTGLNFLEAMAVCNAGGRVTRAAWGCGHVECNGVRLIDETGATYYSNNITNILATDWQIIEP